MIMSNGQQFNAVKVNRKRRGSNDNLILHQSSSNSGIRKTSRQLVNQSKKEEETYSWMCQLLTEYENRDYPPEFRYRDVKVRSCGVDNEECNCPDRTNCYLNAKAYKTAFEYQREYPDSYVKRVLPPLKNVPSTKCHSYNLHEKCASAQARHQVPYYDSGRFGEAKCDYCHAILLPGEKERYKKKRTACCLDGAIHTEEMKADWEELQNMPQSYNTILNNSTNARLKNEFLDKTLLLNNNFAFASVNADEATLEEKGGRADICKYNGLFSHYCCDLFAPAGMTSRFAQVYTLAPEDAISLRMDQFSQEIGRKVSRELLTLLEEMMRANPFAETCLTAAELHKKASEEQGGTVPYFQIVLLTHRELKNDAIINTAGRKVVERVEAPTAKQIAVIWIQDDGLAPDLHGIRLYERSNEKHIIHFNSPNVDPACFPLLHPRGTQGWRWTLDKGAYNKHLDKRRDNGIREMNENLIEAQLAEIADFADQVMHDDSPNLVIADDTSEHNDDGPQQNLDCDDEDVDVLEDEEEYLAQNLGQDAVPGIDKSKKISVRQFYNYRFAIRESKKEAFHWLWFAKRLAEYFTICILNRIERFEMNYLKKIQMEHPRRKIIAADYLAAIESRLAREHAGAKLGRVFLMPATFAGSRQYYQEKYADLMNLIHKTGAPTWFVTYTGNPKWPELQIALQKGQDYTHRPDLVCRLFMDKALEFIKDVTVRHILGKVAAYCYSVEHQKRGMPHIHMLIVLDPKTSIHSAKQVDQYINARIPYLPQLSDLSVEAHQQRRLWYQVISAMLHDCDPRCGGDKGKCSKHFPKNYNDETILADDRYSEYKRFGPLGIRGEEGQEYEIDEEDCDPDMDPERTVQMRRVRPPILERVKDYAKEGLTYWLRKTPRSIPISMDDKNVVSYNNFLLLKYGAHINIEFVHGQRACKYIFKYLLKGFDKAYVKVCRKQDENNNVYDYDEIESTFKVRYMTATEAYLRMQRFPIVRLSHQIYKLPVHEDKKHTIIVEEKDIDQHQSIVDVDTRLTGFFRLCRIDPDARFLRYDQVPHYYWWNYSLHAWIKRIRPKSEKNEDAKMFVRVYTVSPKRQELFALRCLLLHKAGPTSYDDLKTVNGEQYSDFGSAAKAAGLLEDDAIFHEAMRDACNQYKADTSLYRYFAMLVLHCQPSEPQKLLDAFLDQMFPAPAVTGNMQPLTVEYRRGKILQTVEYFLQLNGSSCSNVGLHGLPTNYDPDVFADQIFEDLMNDDFYGTDYQARNARNPQRLVLDQIKSLNIDQFRAFEEIKQSLLDQKKPGIQKLFFLEGAGGCGKTYLYNTLIKWCLAGKPVSPYSVQQKLETRSVIAAASTGIAGLMLIGGGTVHRQFYIPNDPDETTPLKLGPHDLGAKRLVNAELIVIDELSMLHIDVMNYLDRQLREVCRCDEPYGGKIIVAGGDWRQLAPVVEGGGKYEQIKASVKMSVQFRKHFKTLRLLKNLRADKDQLSLAEWLLEVGAGKENGKLSQYITIKDENCCASLKETVDFCFPRRLFDDPLRNRNLIVEAAMLCPRNDEVARVNDFAMNLIRGETYKCLSIDTPLTTGDGLSTFVADFNLESVHEETPTGLPPHILSLKIGAPVMLIRNLDVSQGLCNGTRLQVLKISQTNLTCRILTGPKVDTEVLIPLVKFDYGRKKNHRGARFTRLQFPVRICFAMTVNKSQGQTLRRVGLILSTMQCFAHGQVYVGVSRVTRQEGIRICSPVGLDGKVKIRNVVYQELLC